MHILVGADRSSECRKGMALAQRLGFPEPLFDLMHVVEPLPLPGIMDFSYVRADLIDRLLKDQEDDAKRLLEEMRRELSESGQQRIETTLVQGFASNELLARAAGKAVDLLVVGTARRDVIDRAVAGSTCRKVIVSAPCSVLVAKKTGSVPVKGPINAVLATDHSDCANRCIDLFLKLKPAGIRCLTVMTAYPFELPDVARSVMPHFKGDLPGWIAANLAAENQKVIDRLAAGLSCEFKSRVIDGSPEQGIDTAMAEAAANLLILGAQGHGFIQRAMVGSVSHHQALYGKHDTFILRAGDRAAPKASG
jgi:nucleotide-binding universal stress UspA family protein